MLTRTFATLAATLCLLSLTAAAAPPAIPTDDVLYRDALAKEAAVRTALTPSAAPTVLKAVRTVIEQYEAVVARYPVSSYSDDALWRAGELAIDAYKVFGDAKEKTTATRNMRSLTSGYPASKYAKQVAGELARVAAMPERAPIALPDAPTTSPTASTANVRPKPDATGTTASGITTTGTTMPPARPKADATDTAVRPKPDTTGATSTGVTSTGTKTETAGVKRTVSIRDIRRIVMPDVVRIVIDMDGESPFHDERIADPLRIFVDMTATTLAPALLDRTIRFDGDTDVVRQIRTGRHPDNTARIVLEAAGISSYSVYPLYSPYRLVIDCVREKPLATTPAAPAIPVGGAPRTTALPPAVAPTPSVAAPATVLQAPDNVPMPPPVVPSFAGPAKPAAPPPTPVTAITNASLPPATLPTPAPPAKNLAGGFSIARQLGLGVSKIVIDPGHGGHDPGAMSNGMTEAELVLDVALRLEKLLQKQPGVEVVLTRRTDEFVALQERTAIANREGADLFLSIHANASTSSQARGIETYYLNFASNLSAASVAARENAASGQAMGALPDFVKAIALNNKLDESRDLATLVQGGMLEKAKDTNKSVKDLGVKQAPFVVLIGAAMPSVLAELAFVTNAQEAKLLKGTAYRQRLAEGLFNAIKKYQTSLKSVSKVAEKPQ